MKKQLTKSKRNNAPKVLKDKKGNIQSIIFTISPSDAPVLNRFTPNIASSVTGMFYFLNKKSSDYKKAVKLLENNGYQFVFKKRMGNFYKNIISEIEKVSLSKKHNTEGIITCADELDNKIISFLDFKETEGPNKYLKFNNNETNFKANNGLLKRLFYPNIVEVVLNYKGQIFLNTKKDLTAKNVAITKEHVSETKDHAVHEEGKRVVYLGSKYERSSKNRKYAIEKHGVKCLACKFSFKDKYGEIGSDFIEIHHSVPLYLAEKRVEYKPNIDDFIPLCSNCHSIVHRKRDMVLSLAELKCLIRNSK